MKEIIKLAKKELKPKPKIIRLGVYSINKPAISLYKKFGFKKSSQNPTANSIQRKINWRNNNAFVFMSFDIL